MGDCCKNCRDNISNFFCEKINWFKSFFNNEENNEHDKKIESNKKQLLSNDNDATELEDMKKQEDFNLEKKKEFEDYMEKEKKEIEDKKKELEDKKKELENQKKELDKERESISKEKEDNESKLKKEEESLQKRAVELNKQEAELNKKEEDINNKNKEYEKKMIEFNQQKRDIEFREQKQLLFEQNKDQIIEDLIKKRTAPILIGLDNIGATCYMNATLQCLSNTKQLTEFFLNKYQKNPKNIMVNEYHDLILNLWNRDNNNNSFSPDNFKNVLSKENPLFAGIAANDSKDLINFLLERFHNELNQTNESNINNNIDYYSQDQTNENNNINNINYNIQDQTNELNMLNLFLQEFSQEYNSPISHLFYGIMETKAQCSICQIIKFNFQVYSFLEFPLQQVNQFCFNNGRRPLYNNDGTNPDVDLYECFDYYGKIDLMNGENQMYCNICNQLTDTFYSTSLYSAPNNLIINLNRGKGAVYECKVNFPEILNIINYVYFKNGVTVYELYAVICHLGPSSMSGHFVAYCRNRMDNKWYLYNDGFVTPCNKKRQYQEGMPYILFYRAVEGNSFQFNLFT